MYEDDVLEQQQAYEQKPVAAICDICGDDDRGTAATLAAKGWGLYPKVQFCPFHQNEV